jgi:hypothetical protein
MYFVKNRQGTLKKKPKFLNFLGNQTDQKPDPHHFSSPKKMASLEEAEEGDFERQLGHIGLSAGQLQQVRAYLGHLARHVRLRGSRGTLAPRKGRRRGASAAGTKRRERAGRNGGGAEFLPAEDYDDVDRRRSTEIEKRLLLVV